MPHVDSKFKQKTYREGKLWRQFYFYLVTMSIPRDIGVLLYASTRAAARRAAKKLISGQKDSDEEATYYYGIKDVRAASHLDQIKIRASSSVTGRESYHILGTRILPNVSVSKPRKNTDRKKKDRIRKENAIKGLEVIRSERLSHQKLFQNLVRSSSPTATIKTASDKLARIENTSDKEGAQTSPNDSKHDQRRLSNLDIKHVDGAPNSNGGEAKAADKVSEETTNGAQNAVEDKEVGEEKVKEEEEEEEGEEEEEEDEEEEDGAYESAAEIAWNRSDLDDSTRAMDSIDSTGFVRGSSGSLGSKGSNTLALALGKRQTRRKRWNPFLLNLRDLDANKHAAAVTARDIWVSNLKRAMDYFRANQGTF